jgi:transcription elongation factor Elf1
MRIGESQKDCPRCGDRLIGIDDRKGKCWLLICENCGIWGQKTNLDNNAAPVLDSVSSLTASQRQSETK